MLILLGIEDLDSEDDLIWLCKKISNLRIFNDNNQLMNLSLADIRGEILVVSQFTLFASTKKGNRPSYTRAARPEKAINIYDRFIKQLKKDSGTKVEEGVFGGYMEVSLINDGPVTICIDTKNKE